MGRSFSSIFGFGEPLFCFTKLLFEVPNPPLERSKVPLGCEVQRACNALHAPTELPVDPTLETKAFHHQPLNRGVLQQLRDPRVLEKPQQALSEVGHGRRPV
jgi:hypothetical protein